MNIGYVGLPKAVDIEPSSTHSWRESVRWHPACNRPRRMNSRHGIKFIIIQLCLLIGIISLSNGCVVSSMVYSMGIKRFEVFGEPQKVLVSHDNQAIAVEFEAFTYLPKENGRLFNGKIDGQTTTTFFANHPLRRRYLVADRATIEKEIRYLTSHRKMGMGPASSSDEMLFCPTEALPNGGNTVRHGWNVVPTDMDAPAATLQDLPAAFSSGYNTYPSKELIPWKSDDGRAWQLTIAGSENPRTDRPLHFYDLFYPAYIATDIILFPIVFTLVGTSGDL